MSAIAPTRRMRAAFAALLGVMLLTGATCAATRRVRDGWPDAFAPNLASIAAVATFPHVLYSAATDSGALVTTAVCDTDDAGWVAECHGRADHPALPPLPAQTPSTEPDNDAYREIPDEFTLSLHTRNAHGNSQVDNVPGHVWHPQSTVEMDGPCQATPGGVTLTPNAADPNPNVRVPESCGGALLLLLSRAGARRKRNVGSGAAVRRRDRG